MAPEQALGKDVGPWTDLYSLGVMAYEMLVGRLPFPDTESAMALLMKHVNDPVPPPRSVNRELDEDLATWIERLLEKSPEQRIRSAADAWDELEETVIRIFGARWRREARLPEPAAAADTPRPLTPAPFSEAIPDEAPGRESARGSGRRVPELRLARSGRPPPAAPPEPSIAAAPEPEPGAFPSPPQRRQDRRGRACRVRRGRVHEARPSPPRPTGLSPRWPAPRWTSRPGRDPRAHAGLRDLWETPDRGSGRAGGGAAALAVPEEAERGRPARGMACHRRAEGDPRACSRRSSPCASGRSPGRAPPRRGPARSSCSAWRS